MTNPKLKIILASPRGFCAGVERAIKIVEQALQKHGAPVYVRHEIVHNKFVVQNLEAKGAVFVQELDEVPNDRPVVFSAHGVPKIVPTMAKARDLLYFDATCPLVSKVHRGVEYHVASGRHVLLVGHQGHPEVIGTMGQVEAGKVSLIETVADAESLVVQDPENLAYATQTTLSVTEVADIIAVLQRRFPKMVGPRKEDICYATTNRQLAVKTIAPQVDAMIIMGAPNSSNSMRLVEVAQQAGCATTYLCQRAESMNWQWLVGVQKLGISAGASAPEVLVEEVIQACAERFEIVMEELSVVEENIHFNIPKSLQ